MTAQLAASHITGPTDPEYLVFLKVCCHLPRLHRRSETDISAQYEYIFAPTCWMALAAIEISVLLLYRRIFRDNTFHITSIILIVAWVLWAIPTTIVQAMTCNPPYMFWTDPLHAKCIYYGTFYIVVTSVEIFLCVCVLLLPIREVRRLQLPGGQKMMILGIFALGGL
jgi:hypothetical protein